MAEQTTTEVHRCYDVSFKLRAVEVAEKESKEITESRPEKNKRMVCSERQIDRDEEGKSKCKRLKGGGRRPMDDDMEDYLFQWICEMREKNLHVSCRKIIHKAKTRGKD